MNALPQVLPILAGGAQAFGTLDSSRRNARALDAQGREALSQGYADEATQRRQNRFELSKQAAAIAQSGGGYGGTNEKVMQDSHLAAEMDALNYRYRGIQRARGLYAEAKSLRRNAPLLAGAQLLSAAGQSYSNSKLPRRET